MKKLYSPKLTELVVKTFVDAIKRGEIKIGETLASERELSEQLNISRGTLREGLAILEFLGVIINRGNKKIVERNYEHVESVLNFVNLADRHNIVHDYIEYREFIELKNIENACIRSTDEDIKELYRVLEEIEKNYDISKVDHDFHLQIAKMGQNEFMTASTEFLFTTVNDLRPKLVTYPGRKKYIFEECTAIYEAIKARNVQEAQEAMKKHLFFIESTLKIIDSF